MKTVPLQLLTLNMDNGQRITFVGGPVLPAADGNGREVQGLRFSTVQDIPAEMTVSELIAMVESEGARAGAPVH